MIYFILFFGLLVVLGLYIRIAPKLGIVDKPNVRSSHSQVTVRGGGIIFPVAAICWFIYSGFQFHWFFTGLIIISLISYWDDLSSVSSKIRLIFHFIALLLLAIELGTENIIWWLWVPVLIVSAGAINSYNFMDGINGITAGYSLSILVCIWITNNYQQEFISNELLYFIIISVCVFSFFNFRTNAKCFAGDIGAISLAYIIVFLLIKLIIQSGNWLYILFLCIYGVDSVSTILIRLKLKENIFAAHRKHLYQLLVNELKISHIKVAIAYSIFQVIISMAVFYFSNQNIGMIRSSIIGVSIIGISAIIVFIVRHQVNKRTIVF